MRRFLHVLALCGMLVAPAFAATTVPQITGVGVDLTTGAITGTLGADHGGTGVANNSAATLTRSGNHALTLTTTDTTSVTLPTSGTLATLSGNTFTGDQRINGTIGVGTAVSPGIAMYIGSTDLPGANTIGASVITVAPAAATGVNRGYLARVDTSANAFTVDDTVGFDALDGSKGAGSTITRQTGLRVADLTAGATNYGLRLQVSSGANKWNVYADGTASNYFGGQVVLAATSSPAAAAACTQWTVVVDADYLYVCTASGVWKRAALTGGY